MYRVEGDVHEVFICNDDVVIHEIGALESECQPAILKHLAGKICQKMNDRLENAWVGKAFFAFLRALDGELTVGEIIVLMEHVDKRLS